MTVSIKELRRRLRYDPDTGAIYWRPRDISRGWNNSRAGSLALNSTSSNGYSVGQVSPWGKFYAHRVAWAIHFGAWPAGRVDHINGDKRDNRIANLRDVSAQENSRNMKMSSRNKSGVIGVHWNAQIECWAAQIRVSGRTQHLGSFQSIDEAASARAAAEAANGYHENHGRAADMLAGQWNNPRVK